MANLFTIWAVDDELAQRLEDRFRQELGNPGVYAHWSVFRSATEAVEAIRKEEVPDVALIDMYFHGQMSHEEDAVVGNNDTALSRGLVVGAALNTYAGLKRPRFTFYTAKRDVRDKYYELTQLPLDLGLRPLLQIIFKADPLQDDVDHVLTQVRLQTEELAKDHVQNDGIPNRVCEKLRETLDEMRGAGEPLVSDRSDFRALVAPEIERLAQWWDSADHDIRAGEELPIHSLGKAQTSSELELQLKTANGKNVGREIETLRKMSGGFWESRRERLIKAGNRISALASELSKTKEFQQVSHLFPFQAQVLDKNRKGHPRTVGEPLIEALQSIVSITDTTDYTYILARSLKKIPATKGTAEDTKCKSKMAAWIHSEPINGIQPEDITEKMLEEELQVLPSNTLGLMKRDGETYAQELQRVGLSGDTGKSPLLRFAHMMRFRKSPLVNQWLSKWSDKLRQTFPLSPSVGQKTSTDERIYLTDWREFFCEERGVEGVFVTLRDKLGKSPIYEVRYVQGKHVSISLAWKTAEWTIETSNAVKVARGSGGDLSRCLQRLSGWGRLTVKIRCEDETPNGTLVTIPFEPDKNRVHSSAKPDTPRFQLDWVLTIYRD